MTNLEKREEVLDLLARGKISIDEAVELLDQVSTGPIRAENDEPLYRAEMEEDIDASEAAKIRIDEAFQPPKKEKESHFDDLAQSEIKNNGKKPRWLRVRVVNSETGNNKVTVNIPFGMVKFGLGIARVFTPEMKGVELDDLDEMLSNAEAGLLVDVQDDESNEHVKVFFD